MSGKDLSRSYLKLTPVLVVDLEQTRANVMSLCSLYFINKFSLLFDI